MKSTEIADKYAQALYEIGKETEKLDKFTEEIDEVGRVAEENQQFLEFVTHPLVPDEDKIDILVNIFGDELSAEMMNFLRVLVNKGREDYIQLIKQRFHKFRRDQENILEVEVTVPTGFSHDNLKTAIENRLSQVTEERVQVIDIVEEEGLIGGAKLTIGDRVIDGTIKSQLEDLRDFVLQGGKDGRN